MMQCQSFTHLPSPVRTLWMGFRNRSARYTSADEIPTLATNLPAFAIDEKHLGRYKSLCGLSGKGVPPFYPLTLAYPMSLRLLSQRAVPFSMFRMLNRKITVSQLQPLPPGEPFDIHSAIASHTVKERGIDLHVTTNLSLDDTSFWNCTNTFFFKGAGLKENGMPKVEAGSKSVPSGLEGRTSNDKHLAAKDTRSTSWFLPHGNGFRFARVCGDSNGIHFSHRYARMLGFEGAFAQPMLVMDKCLEKAGWRTMKEGFSSTIRLKGQLYYGRDLTLTYDDTAEGKFFDLFCEGNERPSISGVLKTI
ncbi:hypothetical protein DSLASN_23940 [Desulfoluna limicola]|uniref:MaoC-like domain-containing protein n=1 Tax=Desulfoluna limicola TaxID=2810562 RepID=A0ABM7PGS9_9BACT|nr:hypothetical protein [Desulfoluna limicola]BCS96762.1 hypothetical protein DSLASN_23940 [Desulfoluna limicola]